MLYVKDGHLTHCYNFAGLEKYVIMSTQPVTSGEHQVRMEFAYEGGGLGKGGTVTLYIDGKSVGAGKIERTLPMVFSIDKTSDLGIKRGSPISSDLATETNAFSGTVRVVVIETDPKESVDHLISHDQLIHILMARQ